MCDGKVLFLKKKKIQRHKVVAIHLKTKIITYIRME